MVNITNKVSAKLVNYDATDFGVVEAMFASTNTEVEGMSEQQIAGRINYLMRERHGTPFEHNLFTFQIVAPIFVARQWMRHRVGWSYSELSGRYADMDLGIYMPDDPETWFYHGKPGKETVTSPLPLVMLSAKAAYLASIQHAWATYRSLLDMGVHREIARMVLPVGVMTTFQASCNARSLMHFLSLRHNSPDNAVPTFPQKEIDSLAQQLEHHFRQVMPHTWQAFVDNGRVAP